MNYNVTFNDFAKAHIQKSSSLEQLNKDKIKSKYSIFQSRKG